VAGHPYKVELANGPRHDSLPGGAVARVETALKADLDEGARLLHVLDDRIGGRQVERDRLLAERRHAGVGGQMEEIGVDRSRSRDDDRVHAFAKERICALRLLGAKRFRDAGRPLLVCVDDGEPRYERALFQGLCVQRPDATDADPSKLKALAKELSYTSASVVLSLGVEQGAVVRYHLFDRGAEVDEYLSVPEFYGPLPPGDVIALGSNPRVASRLTGADPQRVREVARTAATPDELPAAQELYEQIAEIFGVTA